MTIGEITRLMTRHLYALINSRFSWSSQVEVNDKVREELQFWYSHLPILYGFPTRPESGSVAVVYSDASQTGFGGYLVSCGHHEVAGHWDNNEKDTSSPMRELLAVKCLDFADNQISWFNTEVVY